MYNPEFASDNSERESHKLPDPSTPNISDIDLEKIFDILDTFIPLEYCVYYHIIPLSVADKCLNLGMVNIEDDAAIGYIKSAIVYLKYDLKPKQIELQTHEAILSAYLKYRQAKENQKEAENLASNNPTIVDSVNFSRTPERLNDRSLSSLNEAIAFADYARKERENPIFLTSLSEEDRAHSENFPNPTETPEPKLLEITSETSARQLSKQILSSVLKGNIGRLYFERNRDNGKIICSQEGAIICSIEKISLDLFQGTLDEFKILVNLSKDNWNKNQKIEVEKNYKQEKVLLRFQIINTSHGEEGTLQILRGKALTFYKQNKIEQLSRQALELSQKLERKIYQISTYSNDKSSFLESSLALQAITQELSRNLERSTES